MKICFICKQRKEINQFYLHPRMADGHLNKCKLCTKRYVSAHYRANIEHYKEYERSRSASKERKTAALLYQRARNKKFPGKSRARYFTNNAIRDGRLLRKPCEICGEKAQAHHLDYRKKFDVKWLCFKHHREKHGQTIINHASRSQI